MKAMTRRSTAAVVVPAGEEVVEREAAGVEAAVHGELAAASAHQQHGGAARVRLQRLARDEPTAAAVTAVAATITCTSSHKTHRYWT